MLFHSSLSYCYLNSNHIICIRIYVLIRVFVCAYARIRLRIAVAFLFGAEDRRLSLSYLISIVLSIWTIGHLCCSISFIWDIVVFMGSFMNYSYDYVVIPLHYSVMLYFLWFCDDSHLYTYTSLMIRVLYYLSWHVWIIVNLNGPNIRVAIVGIRALVPENLSLWSFKAIRDRVTKP